MSRYSQNMAALEGILFAAGEPIGIDVIAAILDCETNEALTHVEQLKRQYDRNVCSGLTVRRINDRYTLSCKPELINTVARLYRPQHRPALSQAAYEVLAVVAYSKQVTRAQIEAVRGVNSDSALARLLERGYVAAVGQEETPGRPTLFGVTELFLLEFGLASADDLPPVDLLSYEAVERLTGQFREED
ncbi:MAG TPA: SMC-Scp complex subunit ScpB [Clostridiaceae bacterium]|nr:SMC-Scp complex subunit ScpB [Clostridiaceae bacterium]